MTIVLLDCDGVFADFNEAFLREFNAITGRNVGPEAIDKWKIRDCDFFVQAAEELGYFDRHHFYLEFERIICEPGFCWSMKPIPGAFEAVCELRRLGAKVVCGTAPWRGSQHWVPERMQWLKAYFGFELDEIVVTADKSLIYADVYGDDKPKNVIEWSTMWPTSDAFLFDAPHNRKEGDGCVRGGWPEIIEAVKGRM